MCISLEFSRLTHGLLKGMLFRLQVFGDFSLTFLILICTWMPVWAENTLYDFHSSEFVKRYLWPRIQSVLAYILKKMYNLLFLCGVLNKLLTYCDLMVLLNSSTSYWFSVIVLPIIERDEEKSQTMTVDWSISPFSSISCCFMYFVTLFLVHMHLGLLNRFGRLTLLSLCNFPLFPC